MPKYRIYQFVFVFAAIHLTVAAWAVFVNDVAADNLIAFDSFFLVLAIIGGLAVRFNQMLATQITFALVYVWPNLQPPRKRTWADDALLYISYNLAVGTTNGTWVDCLISSLLLLAADLAFCNALDIIFGETQK